MPQGIARIPRRARNISMFKRITPVEELPQFADLPIERICVGPAARTLAVSISGDLAAPLLPIVCIPGYVRNMLDFAALRTALGRLPDPSRAVVLLDLAGRGRSPALPPKSDYSTLLDAEDVIAAVTALGIGKAIFLGQGHGGQVAMAVARRRPGLVGATILVDSGPVTNPRGLVRMRNNLRHITSIRGESAVRAALRKVLSADYPGESEARLDALSEREFWLDPRGRAQGLYDPRLLTRLDAFDFDDVLEPQWPLFDVLSHAPLMLVRTQLSDQLRRETFDEMLRRRPDAATLLISGIGSPALLDGAEEIYAIAEFAQTADGNGEDA